MGDSKDTGRNPEVKVLVMKSCDDWIFPTELECCHHYTDYKLRKKNINFHMRQHINVSKDLVNFNLYNNLEFYEVLVYVPFTTSKMERDI